MFPFVVDHRYTLEPSLALYHSTKAAFRANTRGRWSSTKPSPLAPPGLTTTSPTLASEFQGLTYSANSTSDTPPPAYTPRAKKQRSLRSSTSSDTSDLSAVSESEEDEAEKPQDLSRISTATSAMKKAMKLDFLRRKRSNSS